VNLLAKPIADVRTAADFSSIMALMRELGMTSQSPPILPTLQPLQPPVAMVGMLPDRPARA
jgi:hypothetical protein